MGHPWTVEQDRQHGVYVYIRIYNMYCTRFTVNTSEVHSHISITCSNSMRISLGRGRLLKLSSFAGSCGITSRNPALRRLRQKPLRAALTRRGGGQARAGKSWTSPELRGQM